MLPTLILSPHASCFILQSMWTYGHVPKCLVWLPIMCQLSSYFLKLHSVALGSSLTQLCQLKEISEFTRFPQTFLPQGLSMRLSFCFGSLWPIASQASFLTSFRALPGPRYETNPPVLATPVRSLCYTFQWYSSSLM